MTDNTQSFNKASALDKYKNPGLTETEDALVAEYVGPRSAILVVGCGGGRTSIPLCLLGHDVTAFDIAGQMVAQARAQAEAALRDPAPGQGSVVHFQADATAWDYPREAFDVVFIPFNSLDYIQPATARQGVLASCFAATRPGGLLLYSSHVHHLPRNRKSLWLHVLNLLSLRLFRNRFKASTAYGPIVRYQGNGQPAELRRAGYELLESRPGRDFMRSRLTSPFLYFAARKPS